MSSPARLLKILGDKGSIPPGWADTVGSVPRELFLPDAIEVRGRTVVRSERPGEWLAAVYDDVPVITQVNDGQEYPEGAFRLPTSSSSMPTIMLEMLGLLQAESGHRVLELGTGTGWNAAWLAHRIGSGAVTSVDVDPALVAAARANCRAAGLSPRIVCGRGEQGRPDGAPYDRLIATYTTPIPYAWVEQVPAGRIVAPWGGSFFSHSFAVLDTADGRAHGRFCGYPAFMGTRTGRPARGYLSDFLHHRGEERETRSPLSPLNIAGDAEALFFVGLDLPDAWYLLAEADDNSGESTLWILGDDRSSWACADYEPGAQEFVIGQYGPRNLWDEAERSYRKWERRGRPERDRAGISVTREGEQVWLDTPENVIA
ncbi:methyltransferase domain-containing protein [Streptomyces pinistramenti]|uniref:methyltransferase domain-containing protein n=1 Tax=Streptomyces pinistramenti TaxID=2884812 RepID=UPI001D073814|nr:methyltransferase domain-containing protein [Streptomyces pinistramenti]MCB5907394.1 methyltransferase domain-containing protein [Streptomyces pinistramenti]